MKRIFQTLAQKWPEFLLEILVISIGILVAFGLNNWNQNRKDLIKEALIIEEINYEFRANQKQYADIKQSHWSSYQSAKWMIENYKQFDAISLDTLGLHVKRTLSAPTFDPSQSSIEGLISTQSFDIIRNKELKKLLIGWKDALKDYQGGEISSNKYIKETLIPHLGEYLDYEMMVQGILPSKEVFQSRKTKNLFYRRYNFLNNVIGNTEVEIMINEIVNLTNHK